MSEMDSEDNIVIASNDGVNWNGFFDKIKPNLKYYYYEKLLNNFVNDLIQLYQVSC